MYLIYYLDAQNPTYCHDILDIEVKSELSNLLLV